MNNLTFICLFTTGRSGTAFLTQIFSQQKWIKNKIYLVDNNLFTHENWTNFPIIELKKLNLNSKESIKIQSNYIKKQLNNVKIKYPNITKYFVSSRLVGIWLGNSLPYLNCNYKIIYLERKKEDVINSFYERYKHRKNNNKNYKEFFKKSWTQSLYAPSDHSTIKKIDNWNDYNYKQKIEWYCDETKLQWEELKLTLNKNNYLELPFQTFDDLKNNGLDVMSKFINIPYSKKLLNVYVNQSNKKK